MIRSGLGAALGLLLALGLPAQAGPEAEICEEPAHAAGEVPVALSFTMQRIDGTEQSLLDYQGQVLLLVNVASQCGLTPQYQGLEALYARYRERGFAVLGFPANDFAGQEPGSNQEIAEFCRSAYGVEFPMFAKISLKGDATHPLYKHLTSLPAPIGGPVQWNFQKYLVSRSGDVVARFDPRVSPDDPALLERIESLLAETP
jgi:glutathione peroxidase